MARATTALVTGTPDPEQLVCRAARNDYSSRGALTADGDCRSYDDVMERAEMNEAFLTEDETLGEDVTETRLKTRTLLRHLMDRGHYGCFEHPTATVAINGVTRTTMAQLTRHRHFTFDVQSLRYVGFDEQDPTEPFDYAAFPEALDGEMAISAHEGASELTGDVRETMADAYEQALSAYQELRENGAPKEEARKVLPLGTQINMVLTANARAWMHLLEIRTKADVQHETRTIVESIGDELESWMPFTFDHYRTHILPSELSP